MSAALPAPLRELLLSLDVEQRMQGIELWRGLGEPGASWWRPGWICAWKRGAGRLRTYVLPWWIHAESSATLWRLPATQYAIRIHGGGEVSIGPPRGRVLRLAARSPGRTSRRLRAGLSAHGAAIPDVSGLPLLLPPPGPDDSAVPPALYLLDIALSGEAAPEAGPTPVEAQLSARYCPGWLRAEARARQEARPAAAAIVLRMEAEYAAARAQYAAQGAEAYGFPGFPEGPPTTPEEIAAAPLRRWFLRRVSVEGGEDGRLGAIYYGAPAFPYALVPTSAYAWIVEAWLHASGRAGPPGRPPWGRV